MPTSPRPLAAYLALLAALCLAATATQIHLLATQAATALTPTQAAALTLLIILLLLNQRTLLTINQHATQDLTAPLITALILSFPAPYPLLAIATSALIAETTRRRSTPLARLFNFLHPIAVIYITSQLTAAVHNPTTIIDHLTQPSALAAAIILCLAYYTTDVALLLPIPAILHRSAPLPTWRHSLRQTALPEIAGAITGITIAVLWRYNHPAVLLAIPPVLTLRTALAALAKSQQSNQSLRDKSHHLETILTASQQLSLQGTYTDLLSTTAAAARAILGAPSVTAYLPENDDPSELRRVAVDPTNAPTPGPIHLTTPPTTRPLAAFSSTAPTSFLTFPIPTPAFETPPLLLIDTPPQPIDPNQRYALDILASQAGTAFHNAALHHRALAQASYNPLTGLLNHRAFQTRLEEEIDRARRATTPLALALIDIDDFAAFNTAHGHNTGDAALVALAQAVSHALLPGQLAARYGGDELALILPATSLPSAIHLTEYIDQAVAHTTIRQPSSTATIFISIGVAAFPTHARNRTDLIRGAIHAAYIARHSSNHHIATPDDAPIPVTDTPDAIASQLKNANIATVSVVAAAVDAKDPYTRGHSSRVSNYATTLAATMSLATDQIDHIRLAGLLHDVGKIGVPDAILTKPSKLTAEEYAVIKQHPITGERMLADVPFLRHILPAIRHHHEHWNGSGYPDSLADDDIPLLAAILMVADSLDAMTSTRTYRRALHLHEATRRIQEGSGTQFSPEVVAALMNALANGDLALIPTQPNHLDGLHLP